MATERITENIVRKHFEKHSAALIIEEQKSANPKIDKLLKNASKKGSKDGRPEYIIQYKKDKNFIIVVECKAATNKHRSTAGDKYGDYAVDGALLYASFLSKEFDVLAIAVSGQNKAELKVSHYLHLKETNKAIPIFGNKLLDADSYRDGYIQSPEKYRQDFETLLDFSKTLNDELHSKKVKESLRSLLISGILIALENQAFRVSYDSHAKPEDLANSLVDFVSTQLRDADLHSQKIENLKIAYSFIRTHTALSGEPGVLANLIRDIDENVNGFIKTHKYVDVLGQFYIEFLRYANSDSGLGIVLTPPHITELFSDLAGVNKNSIVYDNCTGTGGFLISAMRKMIKDANGDSVKIRAIKKTQLLGVEYQDDIFALACANMFIHQDGKTNIIHGSCFDADNMNQIKKRKPNIGFLNPPYQSNKKRDTEELEFVLNNLEVLQPNGTCIAIVPMSCVLATDGPKFELKERLLQAHTLEAVFSMPDALFMNSDVGVVTAIIVITAHKPHPSNKETYFGYWKDDGFVKRKNQGRVDANGAWERIKTEWLHAYTNRKANPGISVNKIVTAKDEWCAEAYMATDYSKINKHDFIQQIKKYIVFKELSQ